jgi:hypothetical protein
MSASRRTPANARRSVNRPAGRKTPARRSPSRVKPTQAGATHFFAPLAAAFLICYVVCSFYGSGVLHKAREAGKDLGSRLEAARVMVDQLEQEQTGLTRWVSRRDEAAAEIQEGDKYARTQDSEDGEA